MYVFLFKDSQDGFLRALAENNIPYEPVASRSVVGAMSGWAVQIAEVSPVATILASVLVSWVSARPSRLVQLRIDEKTVVHLRGLSISDIERLLLKATSLSAMDAKAGDAG